MKLKTFQYKVVYLSDFLHTKDKIEYTLSDLGKDGWELVSVDTKKDWYYLKKQVS